MQCLIAIFARDSSYILVAARLASDYSSVACHAVAPRVGLGVYAVGITSGLLRRLLVTLDGHDLTGILTMVHQQGLKIFQNVMVSLHFVLLFQGFITLESLAKPQALRGYRRSFAR